MTENRSTALHKKVHQAAHTGGMETLAEMIADDVIWHIPGRSLLSGDFHGLEAVMLHFFAKMAELSEGSAGFEDFQAYFGSDAYSTALFRRKATRKGKTIIYPACEVIRWREGMIAEKWAFFNDQYAFDEFWS